MVKHALRKLQTPSPYVYVKENVCLVVWLDNNNCFEFAELM